jgi:transcriptional regulator with XRE-family HTH domain
VNIIGENVRRLRKIHNLNQIEFSRLIGVSQGSLSDIEAGKSKPAIKTVISIHTKFGCSLEWLLTGTNSRSSEISSDTNPTSSELSPFEIELISAFRKLDVNNQLEALEIVKLKLRSIT